MRIKPYVPVCLLGYAFVCLTIGPKVVMIISNEEVVYPPVLLFPIITCLLIIISTYI